MRGKLRYRRSTYFGEVLEYSVNVCNHGVHVTIFSSASGTVKDKEGKVYVQCAVQAQSVDKFNCLAVKVCMPTTK